MRKQIGLLILLSLVVLLIGACNRNSTPEPSAEPTDVPATTDEQSGGAEETAARDDSQQAEPADDQTTASSESAPTEDAGEASEIDAKAKIDDVHVHLAAGPEEQLVAPNERTLNVGDGISVSDAGEAWLFLRGLPILKVIRDTGVLGIEDLLFDEKGVIVTLLQNAGTLFNDFTFGEEAKKWLDSDSSDTPITIKAVTPMAETTVQLRPRTIFENIRSIVQPSSSAASGTTSTAQATDEEPAVSTTDDEAETNEISTTMAHGFGISHEEYTDLEWSYVSAEGVTLDIKTLDSEGETMTATVAIGNAHWVAPDGSIGPPGPFDQEAVASWIEKTRAGEDTFEIGDLLWEPANIDADTGSIDELPAPGTPFMLAGVELTLNPDGVTGEAAYSLADCNGDGLNDIVVEDGLLRLNFRPLPKRVRSVDIELFGAAGQQIYPINPAKERINQEIESLTEGEYELLSARSNPHNDEEPYHFLDVEMEDGCFLGFSLTPPLEDLVPAPPRWPVPPPGLTGSAGASAVDAQTAPAAASPPCVVAACPDGWGSYRVQAGDTLLGLVDRTQFFAPGLTVDEIREANCIPDDSDVLQLDALVCVPAPPPTVTPPPAPTREPSKVQNPPKPSCPPLSIESVTPGRVGESIGASFDVMIGGGCPPYQVALASLGASDPLTGTAGLRQADVQAGPNNMICTPNTDENGKSWTCTADAACPPPDFQVKVTDGEGAKATEDSQVSCPPPPPPCPTLSIESVTPNYHGQNEGASFAVVIDGGCPPYRVELAPLDATGPTTGGVVVQQADVQTEPLNTVCTPDTDEYDTNWTCETNRACEPAEFEVKVIDDKGTEITENSLAGCPAPPKLSDQGSNNEPEATPTRSRF